MPVKVVKSSLPIVALCGRVNVGKSSLFNLIVESKRAIVSPQAGTTRDSNISVASWQGDSFTLVDTAGLIDLKEVFHRKYKAVTVEEAAQKQAVDYLKNADVVIFTVDAKDGLLPEDIEAVSLIKKIFSKDIRFLLAANKADGPHDRARAADFYKLAMGNVYLVSAATGSGVGDLLDKIVSLLKESGKETLEDNQNNPSVHLTILGQPNVGKSSLVNKILGENRAIVNEVAHTTREPQDSFFSYNDELIRLVDTAGITRQSRRRAKFLDDQKMDKEELDAQGIVRSIAALDKSDVVVLVLTADTEITNEDAKIMEEAVGRKKGILIVVNKWDLSEERDREKYKKYIHSFFPYALWVPIVFTSAKTGEKVLKILDAVLEIMNARRKEISNDDLVEFLHYILMIKTPPRSYGGTKANKILKIEQYGVNPPRFKIFVTPKSVLPPEYLRFVENKLRAKFKLTGTPLSLFVGRS